MSSCLVSSRLLAPRLLTEEGPCPPGGAWSAAWASLPAYTTYAHHTLFTHCTAPHMRLLQEAERRLRDQVAGKKPAGMGQGLQPRKASAVPTKAPAGSRQVVFPAKLSMGDDTRILQVPSWVG